MAGWSSRKLHALFEPHRSRIERHARIYFRHIKCFHQKEDYVQETVGIAYKLFVSCVKRGKKPWTFIMALASRAAWSVASGRKVTGQEKSQDAMSRRAQYKHGFTIESLPQSTQTAHENLYGKCCGQEILDSFEERLHDNTQTPPDEQAAFRIDFGSWVLTWDSYHRRIIVMMANGDRTMDIANRTGKSNGRISQMRTEFKTDWETFTS